VRITFKRGVHPNANKSLSKDFPITDFPCPDTLYFSMSQHIGAPAKPIVSVGDKVLQGQLIGEAGSFVSANVFSSVSGTVKSIIKNPLANGGVADHVVIENDHRYEKVFLDPIDVNDKDAIKKRIAEAGIVGMGGATFPTHVKFSPKDPIDTLIINAAECEPYITCDYRLCLEKSKEIFLGIQAMLTALSIDTAYIGIEDNKPRALEIMSELETDKIKVVPLKAKYPQGAEKQMIYAILKRTVPMGGLPAQVGVIVDNLHTAYSIYEAVYLNKPLYERVMTVSGKGAAGGNYLIKTGVRYQDILEYSKCGESFKKLISGGPMMGFSQSNTLPAVCKGTSSLLFLKEEELNESQITQCINCARCAKACPMHLMPMRIEKAIDREDIEELNKLCVMNCIECGSCSYSCPAKRPLVYSIKKAKNAVRQDMAKKAKK
jgi:electron transport complex protein RnfC